MVEHEFLTISDGTYTFTESKDEKAFYLYRNDGEKLDDLGNIPVEFYQAYIVHKMMNGDISGTVYGNLHYETSCDEKYMRISISDYKELPEIEENSNNNTKQPKFLKRMFHKVFGHNNKD